jgi:hypothetical protein
MSVQHMARAVSSAVTHSTVANPSMRPLIERPSAIVAAACGACGDRPDVERLCFRPFDLALKKNLSVCPAAH